MTSYLSAQRTRLGFDLHRCESLWFWGLALLTYLASTAFTVACFESRRSMRRYALLAFLWSVGWLSFGFATIAVRQSPLVGISVDPAYYPHTIFESYIGH
jgi:hypothetical protein